MQQYVINGGRHILHNYKGGTLHLFILAANRISLFVLFVLIPSWSSGRDGVFDVMVVSSLQVALVDRAGSNPSSAIETRFNSKMDTYYNACNSAGLAFFPLVVEVLGAWQSLAQSHIKRLGKALGAAVGRDPDETVRFLYQRLGIALVKGNAALILGRFPGTTPQDIDGVEESDPTQ